MIVIDLDDDFDARGIITGIGQPVAELSEPLRVVRLDLNGDKDWVPRTVPTRRGRGSSAKICDRAQGSEALDPCGTQICARAQLAAARIALRQEADNAQRARMQAARLKNQSLPQGLAHRPGMGRAFEEKANRWYLIGAGRLQERLHTDVGERKSVLLRHTRYRAKPHNPGDTVIDYRYSDDAHDRFRAAGEPIVQCRFTSIR